MIFHNNIWWWPQVYTELKEYENKNQVQNR